MGVSLERSGWLVVCLLLMLATSAAQGGRHERPYNRTPAFDFSDEFYLQNGINPDEILNRVDGQLPDSLVQTSPDPDFADVRILKTTGGFDHRGKPIYYAVNGLEELTTFTNDAAGLEAMEIANKFRAFVFPKADGDPLSPALPNRRQDNLFETNNGYFGNDPLGTWVLVFVSYDGPNVNTPKCQDVMTRLADKNGLDLDDTPVTKTLSQIESLHHKGCVKLQTRALDGSQGFRWCI